MSALRRTTPGIEPVPLAVAHTWLITEKELKDNFLNLKIQAATITMALLFLLSAHLLANDYSRRLENWKINQSALRDRVISGVTRYAMPDGSFFHVAGLRPDPPIQPPQPLSILVKGMDNEVDRPVTLGQTISFGPRQDENPISALYHTPDSAFILQVFGSLFALFFTLDSLTGERERGTLRALLAHPLSRNKLLLGKAIGASISLFVSLGLAYFSAVAYLYFAEGFFRESGQLARSILVFVLGLLYALVFLFLGLCISSISGRTKTTVVTGMLAWSTLVLVLPNAAVLTAKIIFPTPTINEVSARLYKSRQEIINAELQANAGIKSIFESPNSTRVLIETYELDRQLTDDYVARKSLQAVRARLFASLSPAGALSFGSSDLAGTGVDSFRAYLDFLRSGRDLMVQGLKRQWELPQEERRRTLEEAIENVTSRQRTSEPLLAGAASTVIPFASLIVWISLFLVVAFWSFNRYDVR